MIDTPREAENILIFRNRRFVRDESTNFVVGFVFLFPGTSVSFSFRLRFRHETTGMLATNASSATPGVPGVPGVVFRERRWQRESRDGFEDSSAHAPWRRLFSN